MNSFRSQIILEINLSITDQISIWKQCFLSGCKGRTKTPQVKTNINFFILKFWICFLFLLFPLILSVLSLALQKLPSIYLYTDRYKVPAEQELHSLSIFHFAI